MKTGRKATPTAVKRTNGNPGKRPLNENEPQPIDELGEPPTTLSARAQMAWHRIANTLPWLTDSDREMFGRYCELVALTEECQAAIDANGGPWLPAENGRVYRHPALSTWLEAVAKMRLFRR